MSQLDLDLSAGIQAKQDGLAKIEIKNAEFVRVMREAAKQYAIDRGSITADDVRQLAAKLGLEPRHRNCWGAVFSGPGWIKAGSARSTVPSNHGHENPVWKLAEAAR